MGKASISFEDVKIDLMKNREFKLHYDELRPRYEVIARLIKSRKNINITHKNK